MSRARFHVGFGALVVLPLCVSAPSSHALLIETPPGFVSEHVNSQLFLPFGLEAVPPSLTDLYGEAIYFAEGQVDSIRRIDTASYPFVAGFGGSSPSMQTGTATFDVHGDYGFTLWLNEAFGPDLYRYDAGGTLTTFATSGLISTSDIIFDPGLGFGHKLYASQSDCGPPPCGTILRVEPTGLAAVWATLWDPATPVGLAFDTTTDQLYNGLLYWVEADSGDVHYLDANAVGTGRNSPFATIVDSTLGLPERAFWLTFSNDPYFGQTLWTWTVSGMIYTVSPSGVAERWGRIASGADNAGGATDLLFVDGGHPLAWDGLPTMYAVMTAHGANDLVRIRPDVEVGVFEALDDRSILPPATLFHAPNPFPVTQIAIAAQRGLRQAVVEVFSAGGARVRELEVGPLSAGERRRVTWDGTSASGARLASGVYFYRLVADGETTPLRSAVLLR